MSSPLTPSSSASAASKGVRRNPNIEPDDLWKENLKAQIQVNLNSMVQDAQLQLEQNLEKQPADSARLRKEFAAAMDNIQKLATETFKEELERERHERRWATGHELPPELAETMKKEQQAILDQIKGEKSSNTESTESTERPTIDTAVNHLSPSYPRSSPTVQTSVSPNVNVFSPPRLSKATPRTTLPDPDPSSEEDTDEESDADAVHNRRLKSRPIAPPQKSRDDDASVGRSSWEPGSLNLNRAPRPYSSGTSPKPIPEVWMPPKLSEENLASNRPQRRGSTASIRSTGSASATSRRAPVADTIPETTSTARNSSDITAKAEQERARIQDAEQPWRNLDAAKTDGGRRRTSDNMQGSSFPNHVAENPPGTSPVSSNTSTSPSQSRRPPTPPLSTKPMYRKPSFPQDTPSQPLYRKTSFVQEAGSRPFDKVPIPPRSTHSHLSLSRPIEPLFNGDSVEGSYPSPMSATLAYAQAPEGSHDQDLNMRTRSRYPSNESRYVPNPPVSAPLLNTNYSTYYNPTFHQSTQSYSAQPPPLPSHRPNYTSSSSARQPSYSASPYSQTPAVYMPHPPDEDDDADSPTSYTGHSHQQRSRSGSGTMAMGTSGHHDPHQQQHVRPSAASQDSWRSWNQQHQNQTPSLRSAMSNNSLREQHAQHHPQAHRPMPTYTNSLVDPPEGSEEDSETSTGSESDDEADNVHQTNFSSNTSYSSLAKSRSLSNHSYPYANSNSGSKHMQSKSKVEGPTAITQQPPILDEESLEYQQMLAKKRKQMREAAEAVAAEELRKKEAARQAFEEEAKRREIAQAEEAKLKKEEEEARQREEENKAARREAEAKAAREAEAQKKKEDEARRRNEANRRREEKRKEEEKRREEEAKEAARKKEEEEMRRRLFEEEARIEQAREDARREEARREELRREEAELRRREDETRKREDEIRRKEEELQRKLMEDKQKEFQRLEQEARRKEADAQLREQQARYREEEARKKEAEIQERERQLRLAEEELQRREKAAQEENRRRERAAQQENQRREREKAAQEEKDLLARQEQDRIERAERLRQEEAVAEEIMRQNRIAKEEQERLESEIAWKELEKKKAGEAARREEQTTPHRPKRETGRKQSEIEAKQREQEKQQDEERKRAEMEKLAQQEEFRRREEEIRSRKRQDSAAAWETWTLPGSGSASWGNNQQSYSSSSPPFPSAGTNDGMNTPQRSNTTSTSASGWSTKPPSTSSGWSTAPKTPSTSTSASSSNTSRPSNPPPTTPSTPTPKPRTGSAGAAGTPSSNTPLTEEQWQRRSEEQFRAQQERFRQEQERLERDRMAKSSKVHGKDDVIKTFEHHARIWEKLGEYTELRWDIFPWPMLSKPSSPEDITQHAISAYVFSPHYPEKEKADKDRIKEHIRRWHPDRFETKLLTKVVEADKERVKEGAGSVVRTLNDLLTKSNTPSFFS